MNTLERRLEALERESGDRVRFVWIERGETQAEALRKARPLAADEEPMFVGWQSAA
jgi:hypothetical protein